MVVFQKLFYNGLDFKIDENSFKVNPHFICPKCKKKFKPEKVKEKIDSEVFDFNDLIEFNCSSCNSTFRLYVAVYKSKEFGEQIHISVNPISLDWWKLDVASPLLAP